MKQVRRCPICLSPNDAATAITREEVSPSPGDPSVCAYCGRILIFGAGLTLRVATPEDVQALPFEVRVLLGKVQLGLRRMWRDTAR